jgi:hypothetical protein
MGPRHQRSFRRGDARPHLCGWRTERDADVSRFDQEMCFDFSLLELDYGD